MILCQATMYPTKNERLTTYCMRPLGHAGKHEIEPTKEDLQMMQFLTANKPAN